MQSLERISCGGIILDTNGEILALNKSARAIMTYAFGVSEDKDIVPHGRELIKKLMMRGRTRISLNSDSWVLIERDDKRPLIMHAIPTITQNIAGPHTILILIDLDQAPVIQNSTLERIFELTKAEAKLAVILARGASTMEATRLLGVSIATVRSQLAAIFLKTRTTRQAELVRLLGRLAMLP